MSEIDCWPHETVGSINGNIPVYHPLAPIGSASFTAGPSDVLLGGGSGELSATVVPLRAAFCLLAWHLTDDGSRAAALVSALGREDHWWSDLTTGPKVMADRVTFGWCGDEWGDLYPIALKTGYDPDEEDLPGSVEDWYTLLAGIVVVKNAPQLLVEYGLSDDLTDDERSALKGMIEWAHEPGTPLDVFAGVVE